MTKFLIRHALTLTILHLSKLTCTTLVEGEHPNVLLIKCLLDVLNDHVTIGSRDLIKASLIAPMYGIIQSIRGALEDINMR